MKTSYHFTLLVLFIMLFSQGCIKNPNIKYNYIEDKHEIAKKEDELQYDHINDKWEYRNKDAELKYNHIEDEWSYE